MAKYIDADKLKDAWLSRIYIPPRCGKTLNSLIASVVTFIDDMPAANVIEIKRGKWIELGRSYYTVISQCSECSAKYDFRSPYCPNCGAKMDGERKQ